MSRARSRGRRAVVAAAVAGAAVAVVALWAAGGWIGERWHQWLLMHGDEEAQWRAAERLADAGADSRRVAERWVLRRAVQSAYVIAKLPGGAPDNHERLIERLIDALLTTGEFRLAREAAGAFEDRELRRGVAALIDLRERGRPPPVARVRALAESGDVAGALGAAAKLSEQFREKAIRAILDALASAALLEAAFGGGDVASGLRVLGATAETRGEAGWTVHAVILAQTMVGDLEGALATLARKREPGNWSYHAVMLALARAGRADAAVELAHAFRDDVARARALAEVARALAEGGHGAEAERVIESALELAETRLVPPIPVQSEVLSLPVLVEDRSDWPLEEIALALQAIGRTLDARVYFMRAALRAGPKNEWLVAEAQARAGDVEGAIMTAGSIEEAEQQALGAIAAVQVERGDLDGALETAAMLPDGYGKARALAEIAAGRRRAGRERDAAAAFEEAFAMADATPRSGPGHPGALTWFHIADLSARSGDAGGAIRRARDATDPVARAAILCGAAAGMVARRLEANPVR